MSTMEQAKAEYDMARNEERAISKIGTVAQIRHAMERADALYEQFQKVPPKAPTVCSGTMDRRALASKDRCNVLRAKVEATVAHERTTQEATSQAVPVGATQESAKKDEDSDWVCVHHP
jgi:hypothetical protein